MHGWLTGQMAASGGEVAASGGSRLFHSPRKRSNFAAGFRCDALVSHLTHVHPTPIRTSSDLSILRKRSFSFHGTGKSPTAVVGERTNPTAYCGIGSNPSDQSFETCQSTSALQADFNVLWEHSKVCFEPLRTPLAAQNTLLCRGPGADLRSRSAHPYSRRQKVHASSE